MQPSTDAFDEAIKSGGHTELSRVVISIGGEIVEDTYYRNEFLSLREEDSQVSYDRTSSTRSSASLKFRMEALGAEELVDPVLRPECQVFSGLLVNGKPEWISMGIFGIVDMTATRNGTDVDYVVTAPDRSDRVRTNTWKNPYQINAGQDYFLAWRTLLLGRVQGFTPLFIIGESSYTTPNIIYNEGDDPWESARKLTEGVGHESYLDRQGVIVAAPVLDGATVAPSLNLVVGQSEVLISPVTRAVSNKEVYNGVVCRSEAPWLLFPVAGEVWDEDPLSPTNRLIFGDRPKHITDATATSNEQCIAIATAEYYKIQGIVEDINFGLYKDPRLEVGDVADTLDEYLAFAGRFMLDKYTYPLGRKPAQGMIRRKRGSAYVPVPGTPCV